MSSSHNPFRTQLATPNYTGASVASTALPSYTSDPPPSFSGPPSYSADDDDDESPEPLPELTPRIPSGRPSQLIAQNTSSSLSTPPSLPPRPSFSSPGPPLPSNRPQTDDDLLSTDGIPESAPPAYSVAPNVSGGELVVEQGPRRPFQRAPEPLLQLSTPPSQQQQQGQRQPPQSRPPQFVPPSGPPPSRPERPNSQLSDFAQDFYNSGNATTPPPAARQQSQQPRYAPPPGPPPPCRPRPASTSSGAGSTAPPASDGRPTTTPTPGCPLLRNGKTLIYPENYLCQKCLNTGYKNNDPSHPCRKCWDRFSQPYTSILASSPWGDQASGSASQTQRGRSFQRPLPAFKPPQAQAQAPPPPPMPGNYPPPSPSGMQSRNSRPMPMPFGGVPPPGSTVVMPGDARIGGRLCWRCGGRGTTPFLIFDEMTCETCGGIGRLVN
ncbi:hypothetical protein F5888DRAFT_1743414 [Russula emetica]|nr:hypothetical protein F5888DRAFT_1743414 [Russula emetica]